MLIYTFDQTMDGVLSAVFDAYFRHQQPRHAGGRGRAVAAVLRGGVSRSDNGGEGIKERMNPKKQLSDMPHRYWRYMTEKQ